jgi:hypothetical protein
LVWDDEVDVDVADEEPDTAAPADAEVGLDEPAEVGLDEPVDVAFEDLELVDEDSFNALEF